VQALFNRWRESEREREREREREGEGERERESERERLLTINKWLEVGMHNAVSGGRELVGSNGYFFHGRWRALAAAAGGGGGRGGGGGGRFIDKQRMNVGRLAQHAVA